MSLTLKRSNKIAVLCAVSVFLVSSAKQASALVYVGVGGMFETAFQTGITGSASQDSAAGVGSPRAGLQARIGLETSGVFYFAFEIFGNFLAQFGNFPREFTDPFISGGLALKFGGTLNQGKSKLYFIAAAEYLTDKNNNLGGDLAGLVLVGGGIGIKQEVVDHLDIFVELRSMVNIASHLSPAGGIPSISTDFLASVVQAQAIVGLDVKF